MKHLQHTSKTPEIYTCNMCFQRNISLLLGRMETRRRARGSGPATLVGVRQAAAALQRGGEAAACHAVLQQRLDGAELAAPVEKAVASRSSGEGRQEARWGEARWERKASGSAL